MIPDESNGISEEGARRWLQEHFRMMAAHILGEAKELSKSNKNIITLEHLTKATLKYAPGKPFPKETRFGLRVIKSISGMTFIWMIMAVIFGILGMWKDGEGYADIAKIFAGAIAGSAGNAAVSEIRKSKSSPS